MGRANVLTRARNIDGRPAETARASIGQLRRQLQAGIPHRIFPGSPIALPSILGEVRLGAAGQIVSPRGLEVGPRLLKRLGGAVVMRAGIEPATPAPLIDVGKDAGADPNRADLNVAIENLPAFGVGVFRAAAGEDEHGAIEARRERLSKLPIY